MIKDDYNKLINNFKLIWFFFFKFSSNKGGHEDSIFDIVWLDDHFLASGSKDSSIVIWKIDDNECEIDSETNLYKIKIVNPIEKFTYKEIDQIRCLNFNRRNNVSFDFSRHLIIN